MVVGSTPAPQGLQLASRQRMDIEAVLTHSAHARESPPSRVLASKGRPLSGPPHESARATLTYRRKREQINRGARI